MAGSRRKELERATFERLAELALNDFELDPRTLTKELRRRPEAMDSARLGALVASATRRKQYARVVGVVARTGTDAALAVLSRESHDQARWRAAVFHALGMCRNPGTAPVLLEWLQAADRAKSGWAARALGRLADPRSFAALRDRYVARGPGYGDIAAAVEALPAAPVMARSALQQPGMSAQERLQAIEAAARMKGGLFFNPLRFLEGARASQNAALRAAATEALQAARLLRPADARAQTDLRPAGFAETSEDELLRASDRPGVSELDTAQPPQRPVGFVARVRRLLGFGGQ